MILERRTHATNEEKSETYVNHWPEMREKNVGLLLWGGVGTGKSFMAGCIANALMEQEVAVCMTNFARIMNELNSTFAGRNEVVDRLCGYPLLVIDDFGMERGTEYALEQIYNIIDSRYRSRKPLIVTTNLTLTELKGTYVGAKFIMPVPCKHRVLRAPLEQQVRIEDSHAAIVTPEEFEQAQKVIMLQHGNHQAGNYTKHQYPLKGKVYCGYCQKLMKYRVLKKLGP